ncbi:hypothetical protein JCM3770_005962 [Rhodotorula araucariae]
MRAGSSSSTSTAARRSRSAESDRTNDTALTPVPEGDELLAAKRDRAEGVDQEEDNLDDEEGRDDDHDSAVSSPRRSKRRRVPTSRATELEADADEDEAPEQARRRGRYVLEISPPADRRRRRGSPVVPVKADGGDHEESKMQKWRSHRRGGGTSLEDDAKASGLGKADAPYQSPSLSSPPGSSGGDASVEDGATRTPPGRKGVVPVGECGETAEDDNQGEDGRGAKRARTAPPVKRVVKRVAGRVATQANGAATKASAKEKVAGRAATVKRRNALAASMCDNWFEVVVRRDPYAMVTATAPSSKRNLPDPRPLSALSIVRSAPCSGSHGFTSYRFQLPEAAGKPYPVKGVVVCMDGREPKVHGPSGAAVVRASSGDGEGGCARWVLVIKRDKAKWVVR